MYVCQTPGIWGALPKGFNHLWEETVEIFLTENVADKKAFVFNPEKAGKLGLYHDKVLDICVQVPKFVYFFDAIKFTVNS